MEGIFKMWLQVENGRYVDFQDVDLVTCMDTFLSLKYIFPCHLLSLHFVFVFPSIFHW